MDDEPRGTKDREQKQPRATGSAEPGGLGKWVTAAIFVFCGSRMAVKPHSAAGELHPPTTLPR